MTTASVVPEPAPAAPFRIDDWEVRPASAELVHAGETVRLEPRVMSVLVCLAHHSPEVVRRQDLLREVWGGAFVGEDVIWRSISDLRRAFGDDARRLIETLPRLGYRLCGEVVPLAAGLRAEPAVVAPSPAAAPLPRPSRWLVAAVCLGVLGAALGAWTYRRAQQRPAADGRSATPSGATSGSAATAPRTAADLVREGDRFYWRAGAKEKIRAADFYQRALALDPTHAPAWAGLAGTHAWRYSDSGESVWIDKALFAARRAIALDPRLVGGYKALAQAETMRGRLTRAIQASLQALEIEPGATVVEYNLACIHAQRGELDRATTLFQRNPLLKTGPGAIPCAYGRALRLLGAAVEARALAEATLAREPFDACSTWLVASLDMDAGALAPALARTQKALEVTPDSLALLALAGELEQALGHDPEAIAFLRVPAAQHLPLAQARLAQLLRPQAPAEAAALLAASREYAESALRDGDETWELHAMLAAADGVENQGASALAHLRDAVEHGFSDLETLRTDPLLAPARAQPGFADLLQAVATRRAEQRARALLPGGA